MDPFLLLVAVLALVAIGFGIRASRRASRLPEDPSPDSRASALPARLPLKTKDHLFGRPERALYGALTVALEGTPYRVFPNVRLNDVFLVEARGDERADALGRLRDRRVDFLVAEAPDLRPVLGIELGGAPPRSERRQERDAVKELAFSSAGLPLVRLDAAKPHRAGELLDLVRAHARRGAAPAPR